MGSLSLPLIIEIFAHTGHIYMMIDDLSAPLGRFVARVSASVATVDRCPGRGRALPAADNVFDSIFAVPTEVDTGYADDTREGFDGGWSSHSALSSRPPRHTGGTRQVLTEVCLLIVSAFLPITFFAFSPAS